jgi:hypothetical protein
MPLTGEELRALRDALTSTFGPNDLALMLRFHLDVNLEEIASRGTFVSTVSEVITYFEREGRLDDLIDAAIAERPKNPRLQASVKRFRQREVRPERKSEWWINTGLADQAERNYEDA